MDTQGNPAAVFVFKAASTLITATNSSVVRNRRRRRRGSTGRSEARPRSASGRISSERPHGVDVDHRDDGRDGKWPSPGAGRGRDVGRQHHHVRNVHRRERAAAVTTTTAPVVGATTVDGGRWRGDHDLHRRRDHDLAQQTRRHCPEARRQRPCPALRFRPDRPVRPRSFVPVPIRGWRFLGLPRSPPAVGFLVVSTRRGGGYTRSRPFGATGAGSRSCPPVRGCRAVRPGRAHPTQPSRRRTHAFALTAAPLLVAAGLLELGRETAAPPPTSTTAAPVTTTTAPPVLGPLHHKSEQAVSAVYAQGVARIPTGGSSPGPTVFGAPTTRSNSSRRAIRRSRPRGRPAGSTTSATSTWSAGTSTRRSNSPTTPRASRRPHATTATRCASSTR